jgi:CRP-like cAMP-binding protein
MKIHDMTKSLAALPFFKEMPADYLEFISGCATHVRFNEGEFVTLQGRDADHFFAIRDGLVALEIEAANKTFTVQTVQDGGLVGWSWLIPPYRWHFDARAITPVSAVRFDAVCVREKCENDREFGYEVLKRFSRLIIQRLMVTRMLLVDMYG